MYFVFCPRCVHEVKLMDEAITRRDINWNWNLCYCLACGHAFEFRDEEVLFVSDES